MLLLLMGVLPAPSPKLGWHFFPYSVQSVESSPIVPWGTEGSHQTIQTSSPRSLLLFGYRCNRSSSIAPPAFTGRCFKHSCCNLYRPSIAANNNPRGIAPLVSPSAIMSRVSVQINEVIIRFDRNSLSHNRCPRREASPGVFTIRDMRES